MQPRLFFDGAEIAWQALERNALRAASGFERLGVGEALAAAVQPAPGAALDADGVRSWLRARIADYKVPRVIEFRDDLPREDSGKIFKRKLREPYWAKAGRRI
jgi:long-chain acyl-CoA synthetase